MYKCIKIKNNHEHRIEQVNDQINIENVQPKYIYPAWGGLTTET